MRGGETVSYTHLDVYKRQTDDITAMMQLLLKIDCKCDKQNENFNNFKTEIKNEITTQNVQIKSDFHEKFDEIKREIKKRNNNLNKRCDIVIKKLDDKLIQIENQMVSNSDNLNNEFTGNKNDMILEKDDESIMSDNAVSYTHLDVYKRQPMRYTKTPRNSICRPFVSQI